MSGHIISHEGGCEALDGGHSGGYTAPSAAPRRDLSGYAQPTVSWLISALP